MRWAKARHDLFNGSCAGEIRQGAGRLDGEMARASGCLPLPEPFWPASTLEAAPSGPVFKKSWQCP